MSGLVSEIETGLAENLGPSLSWDLDASAPANELDISELTNIAKPPNGCEVVPVALVCEEATFSHGCRCYHFCEREIAAAEAAFRESGELAHYVWMRDWQRELVVLQGGGEG